MIFELVELYTSSLSDDVIREIVILGIVDISNYNYIITNRKN